jgi:hypothetical protein
MSAMKVQFGRIAAFIVVNLRKYKAFINMAIREFKSL